MIKYFSDPLGEPGRQESVSITKRPVLGKRILLAGVFPMYDGHFPLMLSWKISHSSPAKVRYGVSFMSTKSNRSFTIVIGGLSVLAYYMWLRYFESLLYSLNLHFSILYYLMRMNNNLCCICVIQFDSLGYGDAFMHQKNVSTMVKLLACCLIGLDQWWLIINCIHGNTFQGNYMKKTFFFEKEYLYTPSAKYRSLVILFGTQCFYDTTTSNWGNTE